MAYGKFFKTIEIFGDDLYSQALYDNHTLFHEVAFILYFSKNSGVHVHVCVVAGVRGSGLRSRVPCGAGVPADAGGCVDGVRGEDAQGARRLQRGARRRLHQLHDGVAVASVRAALRGQLEPRAARAHALHIAVAQRNGAAGLPVRPQGAHGALPPPEEHQGRRHDAPPQLQPRAHTLAGASPSFRCTPLWP